MENENYQKMHLKIEQGTHYEHEITKLWLPLFLTEDGTEKHEEL